MRFILDDSHLFDHVTKEMTNASWLEAGIEKPSDLRNKATLRAHLTKPKAGSRQKLRFIVTSFLALHYPTVDIGRIKNFDEKIDRYKKRMIFDDFPSPSSSSSSSESDSSQGYQPSSQDSIPRQGNQSNCNCADCFNVQCPKNAKIRELEGEPRPDFDPIFFLSLFGIFAKTKNISCRTASAITHFFAQFYPSFRCPTREKSYFQTCVYALPSITQLQLQSFVDNASSLSVQLDGATFKNGIHIFSVILIDQALESICLNIKTQAESNSTYLFQLVLIMFGSYKTDIFTKLRAIISDRAKNQLRCNKLLIDEAKEYGNDSVVEIACQLHSMENCTKYSSTLLLDTQNLEFLKTFSKIFSSSGQKFSFDSVVVEWSLHLREKNLSVTITPEKGQRFVALPLNARVILVHWDTILSFSQRLLKTRKHENNSKLKSLVRSMTSSRNSVLKLKSQLYVFAAASTYFLNVVWKETSSPMSITMARDLVNRVLTCVNDIQSSVEPLQYLTTIPDRLEIIVEFSPAAVQFGQSYVEFFEATSSSVNDARGSELIMFFHRVSEKLLLDQENMMTNESLTDEQLSLWIPLSNQRVESSFAVFKNATEGYDFDNLKARSLLQFNDTFNWLVEHQNCAEIVQSAMKDRDMNKALKKDIYESLVSTDFTGSYSLPESDQVSSTLQTESSSDEDETPFTIFETRQTSHGQDNMSVASDASFMSLNSV